jgi:hypothetical protein
LIDVDAIDFLGAHHTDSERYCAIANRNIQLLAQCTSHALRIVEAWKVGFFTEYHRCGHHGPGQRTHPDLVDTGHPAGAFVPQSSAQGEELSQAAAFTPRLFHSAPALLGQRPRTGARVCFELALPTAESTRILFTGKTGTNLG